MSYCITLLIACRIHDRSMGEELTKLAYSPRHKLGGPVLETRFMYHVCMYVYVTLYLHLLPPV